VNVLTEPWQSGLVARAGLALLIIGVLGGVIGVFVVLRGLSFTVEAFAHTAFPGAVLATAAGGSIVLGGLAAVIVTAAAIALAARTERVSDDAAISVVFTGLFALGAILMTTLGPFDRDITSFLFGSLLGTDDRDLMMLSAGAVVVSATLWALRRPLVATSFDPSFASAIGVRATRVQFILLGLVGVSVVIAVQAVGNMLVLAMLVIPAATARLVTRRLPAMFVLAIGAGVLSALIGMYTSYYASVATGACVVLAAVGLLVIAALVTAAMRRGRSVTVRRAAASSS
jgi:ABC-type Mn2+/Zn2+ transport system permease subunit